MSECVLVTGASGFLGAHLVDVLIGRGAQVRALGRGRAAHLERDGVEQVVGSVTDPATCRAAVDGVDAVYHAAGFVSRKAEDAGAMHDVHVGGTRNVLGACRDAGVDRVVCVSTSGTVGVSDEADFLASEDSEVPWSLIQDWPYYASKAYAEKEIQRFVDGGLPVRIARPSLLLGPGDRNGSSTGDVLKFLTGDIKSILPGGVSAVDVRDVAAVLPALMERGEPGVGYLLTGTNLPLRDFFVLLEQASGVRAPQMSVPRGLIKRAGRWLKAASKLDALGGIEAQTFEMACHYWYVDSSRAEHELGFAPRELAQTVRDTVRDLMPEPAGWAEARI